jgi:hypothetical protein
MTDPFSDLQDQIANLKRFLTDPSTRKAFLEDLASCIHEATVSQQTKNERIKPYKNTMPPPSNASAISKSVTDKNRKEKHGIHTEKKKNPEKNKAVEKVKA